MIRFYCIDPGKSTRLTPSISQPLPRAVVLLVMLAMAAFMVRTFSGYYQTTFGWTRLIAFGANFGPESLPELRRTPHYVDPDPANRFGYDGQFYAQLALDPALVQPELKNALDNPPYRARRIGLPAFAFWVGLGKPWWVLQAYALGNLLFWLLLLGALLRLLWPCSVQSLLCLCAALLGFGVIESMRQSLIDLPAASLLFTGLLIGSWGGAALLGMAVLTRETSLLAIAGALEFTGPPRRWLRHNGARMALVVMPFALWLGYVHYRLHGLTDSGSGNFALPFVAFVERLIEASHAAIAKLRVSRHWFRLLYLSPSFHDLLGLTSLFIPCVYLGVRPEPKSAVWRVGAAYALLCVCLGPAVWRDTNGAARVLLPLTISFYLQLAGEPRAWMFWLFFLVSGLAIPFGVYELWTLV